MPLMELQFQKCTIADLDKLVEISKETFVVAFEKDNNPEDFKTYVDHAFEKRNIEQQLLNPDSSFYFAFSNALLVGYFKLNENVAQTDIKSEAYIELERIYVLAQYQGNQLGEGMLNHAAQIAAQKQVNFLWLGVWENNRKAIRFYEKHGFAKFGEHPYYIGKDEQTDWLMRIDLNNFQE